MSGKLLEAMWRIDATGYSSHNIFLTYRYQYSITDVGNEEISPVEGANCSVITKEMFPRGRFSSQDKAIMDNGPPVTEPQGVSEWRYWMMTITQKTMASSSDAVEGADPGRFFIATTSNRMNNIRDGICYGRWFLEVNFPVDKLDNPPM
ncbi:hypothetical protein MAR_023585 [Mya arenaria]|uniref:Uncharacterized protein n=1 Tax=Mya arenaria TaxID=6604 RepID=A0ABY7DR61_MYAAR|nr:hypothetical protein MAR_023585 [Mya arenaria]